MNYKADGLTDYQISRSTILTAYNSKVTPKKNLSKLVLKLKQPLAERTVSH